jgi:SAM-dependent methyltransferase
VVTPSRTELRKTFEAAARRYQQARPEYPAALFDTLISAAGLRPGDRALEIGCATGKATIPLAQRGLRITALELGPELARMARRNLAGFPGTEVIEADFDTWEPSAPAGYALVFAATSWHWPDPATRYQRAARLLRPGGYLAFWSATHVFPPGGDPIFGELQPVYDQIHGPAELDWPAPGELPDERGQIQASGCFDPVGVWPFDWEIRYTEAGYLALLDTFSSHIAMTPDQRARLDAEIHRRLAARPDGQLRRHWGAALHLARRT